MTQWKQLTIYVDESAHWHHQPVYTALIEQARRHGLAGATATRAIEGFSKNSGIHTANLLDLSANLPIVVTLIDRSLGDRTISPNCSTDGGTRVSHPANRRSPPLCSTLRGLNFWSDKTGVSGVF